MAHTNLTSSPSRNTSHHAVPIIVPHPLLPAGARIGTVQSRSLPPNFDDVDEATRADSFDALAATLERGNRTLSNGGMVLFEEAEEEGEDGYDPWMDRERVQALYTLVR